MATDSLFGNHITPACKYCKESIPAGDDNHCLCHRVGIVERLHKCRHFYYDPLSRIPKPPIKLEKFDAADFSLDFDE